MKGHSSAGAFHHAGKEQRTTTSCVIRRERSNVASEFGLDVHKDSAYATVMSHDGKVIDQRKLSNNEIVGFLSQYPVHRVTE
jgi:hypothetical protein